MVSVIKMKTISERLREGLFLRHMKQSELAAISGINKGSISCYLSGAYEPKQKSIYKMAKALNVSEAWLMGHDVSPERDPEPDDPNRIETTGTAPVIDGIAAVAPILAQENIVGYMTITVQNPEEYFALIVRGDSMIGAGIPDGCKVLIHIQPTAENGQIVACRVNGDEATLKRFKQRGETVFLLPENPDYEPYIVPVVDFENGEAEILGVVKQIIIDVR